MDKLLCLVLEPLDQRVELWLNGLVVGVVPPGQAFSKPIHEFVCAGENRLRITLPNNTTPRLNQSLRLSSHLVLYKHRGDQTWVEPEVLVAFNVSRTTGERLDRHRVLDVVFHLPVRFPVWNCLEIPPPLSTESVHDRLEDFLMQWFAAWDAGDLNALLPLYARRNRELAQAYGQDHALAQQAFEDQLKTRMAGYVLADGVREPAQWVFQAQRKAAIHRLCNTDGDDLLRFHSSANGAVWVWPHYLAVLSDDVYILR